MEREQEEWLQTLRQTQNGGVLAAYGAFKRIFDRFADLPLLRRYGAARLWFAAGYEAGYREGAEATERRLLNEAEARAEAIQSGRPR